MFHEILHYTEGVLLKNPFLMYLADVIFFFVSHLKIHPAVYLNISIKHFESSDVILVKKKYSILHLQKLAKHVR